MTVRYMRVAAADEAEPMVPASKYDEAFDAFVVTQEKLYARADRAERAARELAEDLQAIGSAFAELHSQALNGVVCDPTGDGHSRQSCATCKRAWDQGIAILDKYDSGWGNLHRPGATFQPDTEATSQGQAKRSPHPPNPDPEQQA